MRKRLLLSLLVVGVIAVLYVATWVGGPRAYRRDFEKFAAEAHRRAVEMDKDWERAKISAAGGMHPRMKIASPTGPHTQIEWCIPLFPGLLPVNSSYSVGPLWGDSGTKLIWYNGFRTGFICWCGEFRKD
jgi:hypothetical protein